MNSTYLLTFDPLAKLCMFFSGTPDKLLELEPETESVQAQLTPAVLS